MSNVCRIGIKYMAEKTDEQQQQLDHALVMSIQADHKAGMQGQPLPYQLRSDAVVTSIESDPMILKHATTGRYL